LLGQGLFLQGVQSLLNVFLSASEIFGTLSQAADLSRETSIYFVVKQLLNLIHSAQGL
jgi:hypothetical protein